MLFGPGPRRCLFSISEGDVTSFEGADIPGVFFPLSTGLAMEVEDDEVVGVVLAKLVFEVTHEVLFVLSTFHSNTDDTASFELIVESAQYEIVNMPMMSGVNIFFDRRRLCLGPTIEGINGVKSGASELRDCAPFLVIPLVRPAFEAIPIDCLAIRSCQAEVHSAQLP